MTTAHLHFNPAELHFEKKRNEPLGQIDTAEKKVIKFEWWGKVRQTHLGVAKKFLMDGTLLRCIVDISNHTNITNLPLHSLDILLGFTLGNISRTALHNLV